MHAATGMHATAADICGIVLVTAMLLVILIAIIDGGRR